MQEVAQRSSRILHDFGQKQMQSAMSSAVKDELGVAKAYMDLYSRLLMDPSALAAASVNFWIDSMRLWQSSLAEDDGPGARRRWRSRPRATRASRTQDWEENFLFDYIKQSYLIAARHMQHAVADVEGLDERHRRRRSTSSRASSSTRWRRPTSP